MCYKYVVKSIGVADVSIIDAVLVGCPHIGRVVCTVWSRQNRSGQSEEQRTTVGWVVLLIGFDSGGLLQVRPNDQLGTVC